jgi:hypothetical protein
MVETAKKNAEITKLNRGKHHLGDFLPKERLEAFLAKCRSVLSTEGVSSTGAPNPFDDCGWQSVADSGWCALGRGGGSSQSARGNDCNPALVTSAEHDAV